MPERYKIRLAKDYFVFSAGHFITFNRDICERLHGHNYRVAAEVDGPLDENSYVVDFIAVRDTLRSITDELDHHMLLPTEHPRIRVTPDDREVLVTFDDRRWIFPRGDCVLLPVANTTAELLARWIGLQLLDRLQKRTGSRPEVVRIEVDECYGQLAVCELTNAKSWTPRFVASRAHARNDGVLAKLSARRLETCLTANVALGESHAERDPIWARIGAWRAKILRHPPR